MPSHSPIRDVPCAVRLKHSSRCRVGLCLCIAIWAITTAPRIRAQAAPSLQIEWDAPRECPDQAAVLAMLQEHLPSDRAPIGLHARAQVVRRGPNYRLVLDLQSPQVHAHRSLSNPQCAPLAEAAAVLIALAVDSDVPGATSPSTVPEPEPTSPATTEPAPAPSTTSPQQDTQPASEDILDSEPGNENGNAAGTQPSVSGHDSEPSSRVIEPTGDATPAPEPPTITHVSGSESNAGTGSVLSVQLSAAVCAGTGTFPEHPAWGIQAQVDLRIAALYSAVGVTYWLPHEQRSASYPGALLRGSGLFSDVSIGADVMTRPLQLTPALRMELGQINAQASGIAGPEPQRVLWLAAGAATAVTVKALKHWNVALELAGLVPILRTRWLVRTERGDVPAFLASSVALRLSVRIGYAF